VTGYNRFVAREEKSLRVPFNKDFNFKNNML
jgi:hypothetical protein